MVAVHNNTVCNHVWDWRKWDLSKQQESEAGAVTAAMYTQRSGNHGHEGAGKQRPKRGKMTQIRRGEMPYLPSYPEHTAFEAMWV